MQTRKDHVQAYRDSTDRLSSALLAGDAFSGNPPLRRASTGTLFGVLIAVVICIGAYVFGLIMPGGNTQWRQPGTIIVERDTGNRYVLMDGVLRPTLNTASAMLIAGEIGGTRTQFRAVSGNSLGDTPIGAPVGIPGAPDALPDAASVVPAVWSQCAVPGTAEPTIVIALGAALAPASAGDQRTLVAGPDGTPYLIWRDTLHRVGGPAELAALGMGDVVPVAVGDAWLAPFVRGADLVAPDVPDSGRPGPTIAGEPADVGQVFEVARDGAAQTYLLRSDGLAPVGPTAAAMLAARPDSEPPRRVGPAAVAAAPISSDESGLRDLPELAAAPVHRPDRAGVCVAQASAPDGTLGTGGLYFTVEQLSPQAPARLAPGAGMVAAALPAPRLGDPPPQLWLITDQGIRYPVSDDAARTLVPSATTSWMPPEILDALPTGPALLSGSYALTGPPPPAAQAAAVDEDPDSDDPADEPDDDEGTGS